MTGEATDAGDGDDRIALVASVGELDVVVAVLRELLHVASAVRATAVVPAGDDEHPAVVDVARLSPIEVARGPHVVHLPHAGPLAVQTPPLFAFRDLPAFDADPATGDVQAPLGAVEHRAEGVAATAGLLPPGTVLQVAWDSTRPDVAFSVTAQAPGSGQPVVLGIGEEVFPMPVGWPDAPTLA